MTLTVLIGGARAGKSTLAADLAGRFDGPVAVVATAQARDDEMRSRIEQHRARRPAAWTTVEEPVALGEAVAALDDGVFVIVDCLTLWVANLLERRDSEQAIVAEARALARAATARAAPTVVVTNEVGLGIVPATPLGRQYRDVLGAVNAVFVDHADQAALVVAGRLLRLEPVAALEGFT
jgi:adenosylcobinamide kinase / adenosylcobinamide-phosphate guanylyltransferase